MIVTKYSMIISVGFVPKAKLLLVIWNGGLARPMIDMHMEIQSLSATHHPFICTLCSIYPISNFI
jgi:hypothetical protein